VQAVRNAVRRVTGTIDRIAPRIREVNRQGSSGDGELKNAGLAA
jgi:hypothetical protein